MIYLALVSLIAAILYFYVGYQAYRSNRKSRLCRIFFVLNLSMAVWSFGAGFLYVAADPGEYWLWNKIAALGWCSFEAFVLYFVLELTGNRHIRHWYIKLIVLLPAAVFLSMVLFLFGPGIATKEWVATFFYIGNFLYNFTYLAVSILLMFLWGYRSTSKIQKKQAYIISVCSIVPFLMNLLMQQILPALHIIRLPYVGQILTLIMLLGAYYAITKYQFMSIPSALITKELFCELTGLALLTDAHGFIMKANRQAQQLLGFSMEEVLGKPVSAILRREDVLGQEELSLVMGDFEQLQEKKRFEDVIIFTKTGNIIPFNLSLIPLFIDGGILGGVLLIGEDIRATKGLEEEIERHRHTNKRLQKSEAMYRAILEKAPVSIMLLNRGTGRVMYLNSHAEELFGAQGEELLGHVVTDFFVNVQEVDSLIVSYNKNEPISNREIHLTRKDGSLCIGLLTVIPSFYREEEVIISCIIDITERKSAEEMLKRNNAYINKLNKELMDVNTNLMNKSARDGLTNLYNHQYINEVLDDRLKESLESKRSLCLMMMDIDHFKRVNDKYGHLIGDRVLQAVSEMLLSNTRKEDSIGRYGGEEFIIILPDTVLETALEIAEKIRASIFAYDYGIEDLKVSISIGVAQYEGETSSAFINKADVLLYQAKANGRNRVEGVLL